ncbi:MAG: DUF1345 domain-containing protein [Actinomycetia bacterium]|nr:DUF1345 domain-containing protein [Actinomycetes bacterium]
MAIDTSVPHRLTGHAWHHEARWRLAIGVVAGAATAAGLALAGKPVYAILLGWAVAALVFCGATWVSVGGMDAEATAAHATHEVPGEVTVFLLLILAALASLAGIGYLLFRPEDSPLITAGVCLVVIVASWITVQTLHTLRYAREYYVAGGGIDFNSVEPPAYSDFAYVAFTIGMSFAISDTNLTTTRLRRIALRHALLAYLFGTVFLAGMVNILASVP